MASEGEHDFAGFKDEVDSVYQNFVDGTYSIVDASVTTTSALDCLAKANIKTVIRYYSRRSASKVIKRPEAEAIVARGLRLCVVYEVTSDLSYFTRASGLLDGGAACRYAQQVIGQPHGSAIYFAIDFDSIDPAIETNVIDYFTAIGEQVKAAGSPYRIGVYGSGRTCRVILDRNLADLAWLSQSIGWSEYQVFKESGRWALLQLPTAKICNIEVDFDQASAGDFGAFNALDDVAAESQHAWDQEDTASVYSALDDLNPDFRARAELLIKTCADQKIIMVPSNGKRSPQEQAVLWRQSRNKSEIDAGVRKLRDGGAPWLASVLENASAQKGDHVTDSLPGFSWHQWGEALDCYRAIGGKPNWEPKNYEQYADTAETPSIGLTAGGHWKNFKDWPHVQLRSDAGPQDSMTYAVIDARMKKDWGSAAEASPPGLSSGPSGGQGIDVARVVRSLVDTLQGAQATVTDGKPYFFPDGIFKIDVTLGDPGDGNSATPSANPLSVLHARVLVSGVNKDDDPAAS